LPPFPAKQLQDLGATAHLLWNPSGVDVGGVLALGSFDGGLSSQAIVCLRGPLAPHCHERFAQRHQVISGHGLLVLWDGDPSTSQYELGPGDAATIPSSTPYAVVPHHGHPLWLMATCAPPFDREDHRAVPEEVALPGGQPCQAAWRRLLNEEANRRGFVHYARLGGGTLEVELSAGAT
jgi:mannose-6-phosphate isomerase-like protein (cupin superfamily)